MRKKMEKPNREDYLCTWQKCTKGIDGRRALKRKNSIYCCQECKNANARWHYRNRIKKKLTDSKDDNI